MEVKVNKVERVWTVEVTDGYWIVKFEFDRDKNKLKTVFKGAYKSRLHEPVYVPKAIYASFVKRAYAVFYDSPRRKKVVRVDTRQLTLF